MLAFRKLNPGEWFQGFCFPFIADIVSQHTLDLCSLETPSRARDGRQLQPYFGGAVSEAEDANLRRTAGGSYQPPCSIGAVAPFPTAA